MHFIVNASSTALAGCSEIFMDKNVLHADVPGIDYIRMSTYRETHDWGRHSNRDHDHIHGDYSPDDIADAVASLGKLERQLELQDPELIEASVVECRERFYAVLVCEDDGQMPEVFIDLKARIQEAEDQYMR